MELKRQARYPLRRDQPPREGRHSPGRPGLPSAIACAIEHRDALNSNFELQQFSLKICGNQIIRTSAPANIHPCGSGTDQVPVAIERIQKSRLIRARIWLNSPQCIFRYEE
jgi:hypothetical protein